MAISEVVFNIAAQALDVVAARLVKRKLSKSTDGQAVFSIVAVLAILAAVGYYVFWLSEHQ